MCAQAPRQHAQLLARMGGLTLALVVALARQEEDVTMKSLEEDEMKHRLRWVWGRSLAAAPRHPPRGEANSLKARASSEKSSTL